MAPVSAWMSSFSASIERVTCGCSAPAQLTVTGSCSTQRAQGASVSSSQASESSGEAAACAVPQRQTNARGAPGRSRRGAVSTGPWPSSRSSPSSTPPSVSRSAPPSAAATQPPAARGMRTPARA